MTLSKLVAWDLLIRSTRKTHKCLSNPKWLSDWCFLTAHTSGYTWSFQTRTKKKVVSQMPDTNKCGTTCESYTKSVTTAALLWLSSTVIFKHCGKTPMTTSSDNTYMYFKILGGKRNVGYWCFMHAQGQLLNTPFSDNIICNNEEKLAKSTSCHSTEGGRPTHNCWLGTFKLYSLA